MVPTWFSQNHAVRLVTDELKGSPDEPAGNKAYRAALNLPGTDLFLGVTPVGVQPATVPRIFFLVALLFLSGMLVSLWALRRDFVKRQQVQALFAAQVALRTAMENSVTIGLRAWDRKGKILYVNESFSVWWVTARLNWSANRPHCPTGRPIRPMNCIWCIATSSRRARTRTAWKCSSSTEMGTCWTC